MLMLLGWRGAPGNDDEPQHRVQGRQTAAMLAAMDIPYFVLPVDDEGARAVLSSAVKLARENSSPVALLIVPKTFSNAKAATPTVAPKAPTPAGEATRPTREEALGYVLRAVGTDDVLVATTGYTSRELFELRAKLGQSHAPDFLTVGSMGHAIAIAQGIALAQPSRTVWCLDGDGAALMHLGSLAVSGSLGLSNLRHVLLNNGVHDSVGGQPTAASQADPTGSAGSGGVDFGALASGAGYCSTCVVSTAEALQHALARLSARLPGKGPSFIEVQLARGTRPDLGRPTHLPADAKVEFMRFLQTTPRAVRDPEGCGSAPGTWADGAQTIDARAPATSRLGDDALLLTPGPLTTSSTVKAAMMHDIGSRDPRFIEITAQLRQRLLSLVGAHAVAGSEDALTCIPLQGSGTFAVEAMLSTLVPRAGKLLILSNGAYGRRMASMCARHGLQHELLEHAEDAPLDAGQVEAYLLARPEVTHVAVVHCETTTGVQNPLEAIADAVHASGRRLLIDAMSSFGVLPLHATMPFEALTASSNKGLQGSPGLGFCICREAALDSAAGNADSLMASDGSMIAC